MTAVFNGGFLWLSRGSRPVFWPLVLYVISLLLCFLLKSGRSDRQQGSRNLRANLSKKTMRRRLSGSSRDCMPLAKMTSGSTLNFMKSDRLSLPRKPSSCEAGLSCSRFPSGETASCTESWFRSSLNSLASVRISPDYLYSAFPNIFFSRCHQLLSNHHVQSVGDCGQESPPGQRNLQYCWARYE